MTTLHDSIGNSAPPNVLVFPKVVEALRRRNSGMSAAGICSLIHYKMDAPANVEILDHRRPDPKMDRSPESALFLALYSTLNVGQQCDIQNALKRLCRDGDGPSARAALDFLRWADRSSTGRV